MILFLWILFVSVSGAPCFEHLENTPNLIGAYRPQCTPDGLYEKKQCHGSTGYCWCVTPRGVRLAPLLAPSVAAC